MYPPPATSRALYVSPKCPRLPPRAPMQEDTSNHHESSWGPVGLLSRAHLRNTTNTIFTRFPRTPCWLRARAGVPLSLYISLSLYIYIYIYIYIYTHITSYTYIHIYIYIYIYTHYALSVSIKLFIFLREAEGGAGTPQPAPRGPPHGGAAQQCARIAEKSERPKHHLYGDLTVLSPTVVSNSPCVSKATLDFFPLVRYVFLNINFVFHTEIIVGEIIVKSPFESYESYRPWVIAAVIAALPWIARAELSALKVSHHAHRCTYSMQPFIPLHEYLIICVHAHVHVHVYGIRIRYLVYVYDA